MGFKSSDTYWVQQIKRDHHEMELIIKKKKLGTDVDVSITTQHHSPQDASSYRSIGDGKCFLP